MEDTSPDPTPHTPVANDATSRSIEVDTRVEGDRVVADLVLPAATDTDRLLHQDSEQASEKDRGQAAGGSGDESSVTGRPGAEDGRAARPRGAVLCVHGLASQRRSLTTLAETLADHGYVALAPDLRGHGDSQGQRARISQPRALSDLSAWARFLEDEAHAEGLLEAPVRLRAIVGHSLGGLWAMAGARRLDVDAIAMVATPVSIRREVGPLELLAYRLAIAAQRIAGPLGLDIRVPYRVSLEQTLASQGAIERARELGLIQRWLPAANAEDLLALDGAAMARGAEVPAIVARPTRDELVPEASTRALYEALPEPKRWLELDGPHECFFDVTAGTCARELVEALEQMLESAAPGETSAHGHDTEEQA